MHAICPGMHRAGVREARDPLGLKCYVAATANGVYLVCRFLADLPSGGPAPPKEPASKYQGAQVLLPGQAPAANIILAFEYGGGWRDIQVREQLPVSRPFVVELPALLWWSFLPFCGGCVVNG